jgi:integrase
VPKSQAQPKPRKPRADGRFESKGIDPITGKRKSYYSRLSQEDADRQARASFGIATNDSLYGFYVGVYLPTVQHRSANWRGQIAWAMDTHILPAFGHRPVESLTRQELQRFFNALPQRGLMASSVGKVKIVLSGILNLAEDDEVIIKNPLRRVRLPRPSAPIKKALAPEQVWQLIQSSQPALRPPLLLWSFGLRLGEALGVTRGSVRGGVVEVRQQIIQPKGGCVVSPALKTPESYRRIPLPAEAIAAMLDSGQTSGIWVCSNSKGGYLTPNNATRELAEACRRIGLVKTDDRGEPLTRKSKTGNVETIPLITAHELRHTFISILENELECPPAIVAALAGKKYGGPNQGYSHPTQAQLAKWTERYWQRIQESSVYDLTTKEVSSAAQ